MGIRDQERGRTRREVPSTPMKSLDEQEKLIFERAAGLRRKRLKRDLGILSAASLMCLVLITGSIYGLAGGYSAMADGQSMGAFMLSSEAGGYVLVTVLAFAAGASAAVLAIRSAQKNSRGDPPKEDKKDSS